MLRCLPQRTFSLMERLSSWAVVQRIVKINSALGSMELIPSFSKKTSIPADRSWRVIVKASTVLRENREIDLVRIRSILSGYLIQCNDEPGNPFNDSESGSKWPQGVSSLKGICRHIKSASEETLIGGICIEFQLCFPPILPFVTTSCRYTHRTARSRRRRSA